MKYNGCFINKSLGFTAISILLLILVLTLFSFQLRANSLNPQILAPRLSYLDTNKGLDQNTINDVYVDTEGFVWLGTDEGLNRFDGIKVLPVLGPNLELSGNSVFHIFEHSNGLLYLSTLNDGVVSFDRETQKFETVLKKQYAFFEQWIQYADDMLELPNGNMIIALNEEVYRHNVSTKENTLLFQLPDKERQNDKAIRSVYFYNDILLVGTVDGLLAHKLNTKTTYHLYDDINYSIDAKNVKYLDSFDGESLLVGSVAGLFSIPLGEISKVVDEGWALSNPKVIDPNRNIWDMAVYDKNKAYVATDIGLYELNLDTFEFIYLFQPRKKLELLTGLDIINLALDRHNNVWMGTPKSGAMYWSPSSKLFNNVYNSIFTQNEKLLSSNTIWNVHQHDANTVFFATSNGLNKYNLDTGKNDSFYVNKQGSPQYTESEVYSLESFTRQFLWIGTAGGMRKLDVTTGENVSFENMSKEIQTLFSNFIYDFKIISKDFIWIITVDGLYTVDMMNQIVTRIDTESSGLPILRVSQFLGIDTRTNSIIIAASTSVWAIEIDTLEINKLHSTKTASQTIYAGSWVRGRDNTIWVSYPSHGIYKLNGDDYTVLDFYNIENHLPSNISYGLMFDNDGDLWFSSHAGIHVLNVTTNNVQSFSFINGLAQSEFNQNAFAKLADGRFVYGGYMGFSVFNPHKIKLNSKKLSYGTSISEVDLSTRKLLLPLTSLNGQTINLDHDDVGLTLYFSSLDFDVLSQIRFQYRITKDGDTINYPIIETNKISLPLLSPGKHIIEVFTPGTINDEEIATLTIIVNYPPFGSPLAYSAYVVLTSLFLAFLFFRQHKIQAVAQQANEKLSLDNKRLKEALLASNTDTWEWDSESQLIRCNRVKSYLKDTGKDIEKGTYCDAIHIDQYISLIHKSDRENYKRKWHNFISNKDNTFDICYRIPSENGKNIWYRDVGSYFSNDSIISVKGTYTTLNSKVAAQEKLKLFGNAYKHTREWVLIFNKEKMLIATNPAFQKAFGLGHQQINTNKQTSLMTEHQELLHRTIKKLSNMKAGQYQTAESTLTLAGKEITLLSDYNAIADVNNPSDIDYYLIIATNITDQINAQKELQKLANYDALTGLMNQTLLLQMLKQSIHFAKRHNTQLATILIDMDKFEAVNDNFGHMAGDAVLFEVARRLSEKFEEPDSVARLGSDEFVIVLAEISSTKAVDSIVLDLLQAIELPIIFRDQSISVSACAGITLYPNDATNAELLLANANTAMYAAKLKGFNHFSHFTGEMKKKYD